MIESSSRGRSWDNCDTAQAADDVIFARHTFVYQLLKEAVIQEIVSNCEMPRTYQNLPRPHPPPGFYDTPGAFSWDIGCRRALSSEGVGKSSGRVEGSAGVEKKQFYPR